jgi:hypothetical protein
VSDTEFRRSLEKSRLKKPVSDTEFRGGDFRQENRGSYNFGVESGRGLGEIRNCPHFLASGRKIGV